MAEEVKVTLLKYGEAEFAEKKSVFIGYAKPVKDEKEAIEFIKEIKKKHSDARHNVYAYMIGENIMRYFDDGEPQGTGGIPVLDVIRKSGFTDAVIVVTRYFGGILLGAGGLVRAYSAAAKMAVDNAQIVTYRTYKEFSLTLTYTDHGKITTILNAADPIQDGIDYSDNVVLKLALPIEKYSDFENKVLEATAGRAVFNELGQRFDKQ